MQKIVVDDHGGTPWTQTIYQTDQLTAVNGRNPENVVARQLSYALDSIGIDHEIRYGFSAVDLPTENSSCSTSTEVSLPRDTRWVDRGEGMIEDSPPPQQSVVAQQETALAYWDNYIEEEVAPSIAADSNLIMTNWIGGGCAWVGGNTATSGAEFLDHDPGVVVENDTENWGSNVKTALHEIGHNMGYSHGEAAGISWRDSTSFHYTPNAPLDEATNLCGDSIEQDQSGTRVYELWYADCVAETIQIIDKPPLNEPPQAQFDVSTDGMYVAADGSASSGGGGIVEYRWDWGDGASSYGETQSHYYSYEGTYTVTLTVTGSNGETDSAQQTVEVTEDGGGGLTGEVRLSGFSVPSVREGESVQGSVTVENATNRDLSFDIFWEVDGAIEVQDSASLASGASSGYSANLGTYSTGSHTATVYVTNFSESLQQLTDNTTFSVSEPSDPDPPDPDPVVADFDATVNNLHVLVDGRASSGGGGIVEYRWSWGDGTQSTGPTADHDYADTGDYTITLLATGSNGGTDSAQQTVTVVDPFEPPPDDGNGDDGGLDRGTGIMLAGGLALAFLIARPERE